MQYHPGLNACWDLKIGLIERGDHAQTVIIILVLKRKRKRLRLDVDFPCYAEDGFEADPLLSNEA
jgi:hypothetical protein